MTSKIGSVLPSLARSLEAVEPKDRACNGGCGKVEPCAFPWMCDECRQRDEHDHAKGREENELVQARASVPVEWRWAMKSDQNRALFADRVFGGMGAMRAAFELEGQSFIPILGSTSGSGKTSLAVMLFGHYLENDAAPIERRAKSRFVSARTITARGPHLDRFHSLMSNSVACLLLDDVGGESTWDSDAIASVITERASWQAKTIVTTFLDESGIRRRYGDGVARRLFERSTVLTLPTERP